jgi:tetratricopeptide (TPR) repeat protein
MSLIQRFTTRFIPLLLCLAGCNTTYIQRSEGVPKEIEPDQVATAIGAAEEALLDDRPQVALDWMRAASALEGLPSSQRSRVQRLLEISAERFLDSLSDEDAPPELLAEILDLEIPRQLAVTGALRGARLLVERGDYNDAFELIERIDRRFPAHHLRPEAGRLLVESGLALSELKSGWFSSNRDNAFAALEYCSINYPLTPRGDLVYRRLAEMYEEDQRWFLAIARHEELTQNFPQSPLVPYSLARVPHLLLESIESPEYDRNALLTARQDLERWLDDYEGHELTEQVRFDLTDSLVRLTLSDLDIAGFYHTVGNVPGTRFHAARAVEEASLAGDDDLRAQAERMLDRLPPPEDAP